MPVTGWLYDGSTAARRAATVEVRGQSLVIHAEGLAPQTINPEALRPVEKRRDTEVYALKGVEGWRLGLTEIDDRLVEARLPEFEIYGKVVDKVGLPKFIVIAAVISAIVLLILWLAPRWLAPLVPTSVERQIGDTLFADMSNDYICKGPEGSAALDTLAARLAPNTEIDLAVADI
ncbi:MAG: hypothetical protein WA906_13050, partial [Pacificimonas sp.]